MKSKERSRGATHVKGLEVEGILAVVVVATPVAARQGGRGW